VLTGNAANYGGGVAWGTLNNCALTGNSADYYGGGAYYSTLNNCTLAGNAANYGGGASASTLNNCTLTGNSANYDGGGAYYGTLNNSIVYYSTAFVGSGPNSYSSTLNYCCTTPMPPYGEGNITTDPQLASASHLSANFSLPGSRQRRLRHRNGH